MDILSMRSLRGRIECGLWVMVMAAGLFMPKLSFAITDEDAAKLNEPKGLVESKLMGYLWSHTEDQKNAGDANYLKAALGQETFTAKIYNQNKTLSANLSTNGIQDSTSAYIRGDSAKIIAEFSQGADYAAGFFSRANLAVILSRAKLETDISTREAMYLALEQLGLKCTPDAQKPAVILQFLNSCATASTFQNDAIKAIPLDALKFIIEEAEDLGIQAALPILDNLKLGVFKDDAGMANIIDAAKKVIVMHVGKDLTNPTVLNALYSSAIVDDDSLVQEWAIRCLTKENNINNQVVANSILINLLTNSGIAPEKRQNLFLLKRSMDEKEFLRSENLNPSFELSDSGNQPLNWKVTKAANTVVNCVSSPAVNPQTGAKVLEINNISPSTTTLLNDPAVLMGGGVKGIEFGLSYQMAYPENTSSIVTENGVIFVDDNGQESAPEALSIQLVAHLTYKDGSTNEKDLSSATLTENNPYNLNGGGLKTGFSAPDPNNPIVSVQLMAIVQGQGHIYLDDIFVRRTEEEFIHNAPEVRSVSISPNPVLVGDVCTVSAEVVTSLPGISVSGTWVSDIEGQLGSPVTGSGIVTAQVQFSKPGVHTLIFTVKDEYGLEGVAVAKVDVFKTVATIATNPVIQNGTSVSGNVVFGLLMARNPASADGSTDVPAAYTSSGILYSDGGDRALGTMRPGIPFILNTQNLLDGGTNVYAQVSIRRQGSFSAITPIKSNTITLVVANNTGLNIQIVSPEEGSVINGVTPVHVVVSGSTALLPAPLVPTGKDAAVQTATPSPLVQLFLIDQNNRKVCLGQSNMPPYDYTANFSPARYAAGAYRLYAIASNLVVVKAQTVTIASPEVDITIPSHFAPTNLTARAITAGVQLNWQDNSPDEAGFRVYRKAANTGTYALMQQLGVNTTSYNDTTAASGIQYYYKVSAVFGQQPSTPVTTAAKQVLSAPTEVFSNEVSVIIPLAAPTNLRAASVSLDGVVLVWNAPASLAGATNIVIERKMNALADGGFGQIGSVSGNITTYTDTNVRSSAYTYRVRAVNGAIASLPSNEVSVTVLPPQLEALVTGPGQITLHWHANSNNVTGIIIEKSDNVAHTWLAIPVSAGTVAYVDGPLPRGLTYSYYVRVLRNGKSDLLSNTASVYMPIDPPTGLSAVADANSNTVVLSWTAPLTQGTSYDPGTGIGHPIEIVIMRDHLRAGAPNDFVEIGRISSNLTSFTDTNLIPNNTTVIYKIYSELHIVGVLQSPPVTVSYTSAQGVSQASADITVNPAATIPSPSPSPSPSPTVTVAPTTLKVGETLTVNWTAPAGHSSKDWITIALKGSANTSYGAWQYTGSATSGSLTLTAPSSAGTYVVRYLINDGYTLAASSGDITVIKQLPAQIIAQ